MQNRARPASGFNAFTGGVVLRDHIETTQKPMVAQVADMRRRLISQERARTPPPP